MIACGMLILFSASVNAQGSAQVMDVTSPLNSEVVVPIVLNDLGAIGAISFYLIPDESNLNFVQCENLNSGVFGPLLQWNQLPDGRIAVSWFDITGVGITISGQVHVLDMRFQYTDCTGAITFDPVSEISNELGVTLTNVDYIDGSVSPSDPGPASALWTGAADNDWFNTANWDGGMVPACASDVTIGAGANFAEISASSKASVRISSLTIDPMGALTVLGSLMIDGDLTVKSDGSIIESGNVMIGGNTVVERSANGGASQYHMISQPVDYAQAIIFLGEYLRKWDEATQMWVNIEAPSTILSAGEGYSLNATAPNTFYFDNGALNSGDLTKSGLTVTAGGPDPLLAGFHLLGNPFASALHFDGSWPMTGMDSHAWVWSNAGGNYLVADGAGTGTLAGDIIPAMNGFFVLCNIAPGSVTMPQASRVHGMTSFYKSKSEGRLEFSVMGNDLADYSVLTIDNSSTTGLDQDVDAYKLFGLEEAPQLYTKADDIPVSLNSMPEASFVDIYFTAGADGEYEMNFDGMDTFSASTTLDLEDMQEGNMINLKEVSSYTFQAAIGDDAARFRLHFGTVGIDNPLAGSVKVYSSENAVNVVLPSGLTADMVVYNVLGQEVANAKISSGMNTIKVKGGATYIVQVISGTAIKTDKVFVK